MDSDKTGLAGINIHVLLTWCGKKWPPHAAVVQDYICTY